MRQGMTVGDAIRHVQAEAGARQDFVAPQGLIQAIADATDRKMRLEGSGSFAMRPRADIQMAAALSIPKQYYDRMATEAPALWAENVNHWLHREPSIKRLVRTVGTDMRALLSSRYRPIDNVDVLSTILPMLDRPGIRIESMNVGEDRLYVKAVDERNTLEVSKGDAVQIGIEIGNSETGAGAFSISAFLFRLVCLNGATVQEGTRRTHLGRRIDGSDEDVSLFYRDETRAADDRALMLASRDTVDGILSETVLSKHVQSARKAAGEQIEAPLPTIERLSERIGLGEAERAKVLDRFIRGGDISRWGIVNAITGASQDEDVSYDRATELERIGGSILAGTIAVQ